MNLRFETPQGWYERRPAGAAFGWSRRLGALLLPPWRLGASRARGCAARHACAARTRRRPLGRVEGEHPLATARRIGNRQVFLAGWRPHEQLPQALSAADALVLPSVAEAFGLVLVEAMACGLAGDRLPDAWPGGDRRRRRDGLAHSARRRGRDRRRTRHRRSGRGGTLGSVAGALRQTAADTAGRRSLVASRPCARSCSPPLPGSRLRGGGALPRGRLTLFRSTSRSPISQRLPRISNVRGTLSSSSGEAARRAVV